MTSLDERGQGEERKHAHNAELAFKINARRNKLLGLWAAERLGKKGADAESYAKDLVIFDIESPGDDDVVQKLMDDFGKATLSITTKEIAAEIERLAPIAKAQITGATE